MNEHFTKVIYLIAIGVATIGWVWLLANGAIALLGL